ncbi:kinase-like domain-containing protein [Flammula alnicola]|nr:kinase-like domain-containing protein [Flammula alnicola]
MVICIGCERSFPRTNATRCSKCLARIPGLGAPEIEVLNSRPQCAGCGVMSNRLSGLCNGCITFYQSASAIPREFMANAKIMELLTGDATSVTNISSAANSIISSAVTHQETASESRIGLQVRRGSTRSEPAGLKRFKNTHKSGGSGTLSIRAERKEKKADWIEQQATTGPKFSVTLWKCHGIQEKPKQVNQVKFSRVYGASKPMRAILEDLLERLNNILKSQLEVEEDIRWSQITLFAQENAKVGVSIEYLQADEELNSATAGDWQKEFISERYGTKTSLQAGILDICFVVDEALIPDIEFQGDGSSLFSQKPGNSARPSTALASKRKRTNSTSTLTSKRPNALVSAQSILQQATLFREPGLPASVTRPVAGSSSQLSSAQVTSSHPPHILKSAFRISAPPPSQWSREVSLTEYRFTRSTAKYQPTGDVEVSRSDNLEMIAIAEDWLDGETLSKEKKHYKTGYIGCGFTKRGIYARYNDKEYVITQPFDDNMSFSAVREVLIAEFKLLAQCDGIKEQFNKFIQDAGVKVPAFYFNFKDSFYGEIEPLSASGRRTFPHLGFLATPLLPCGRYDDPVQKFTGSDNLGPANDGLTQAIHAFVHFAWVYSREQLLFCDMQGTRDRKKVMCLIDPQAHTTAARNEDTIYWDGGAKKIAAWKKQHLAVPSGKGRAADGLCAENRFCTALGLSTLEMEDLDDEDGPYSPSTPADKAKIGYLLNA